MIELALRSVSKSFGAGIALRGLDLTVRPGELMALLGPSGCGKTTTLRLVSGLDRPSGGNILFDGVDVADRAVQRRNVGMVSQRFALFPHMSVERNISYGLRVRGLSRGEISRRVAEMVAAVQLDGLCQRFPSQLSGGQMQRVAIARTLVTNPGLLLLDEPLVSLDAQLRTDLRGFIRDLQRRAQVTTLLVTHDQVEAMEMADRIAVMFEGRVAQCDTPQTIFRQPASVEVARFVGAANILDGEVVAKDGRPAIRSGLGVIEAESIAAHRSGDHVSFMVRPESVGLTKAGSGAGDRLSGRIVSVSFHGQSVSYGVDVRGSLLRVDDLSRRVLAVGQPVDLAIDPDVVWVFPCLPKNGVQPNDRINPNPRNETLSPCLAE